MSFVPVFKKLYPSSDNYTALVGIPTSILELCLNTRCEDFLLKKKPRHCTLPKQNGHVSHFVALTDDGVSRTGDAVFVLV
jgi:hypothetical protein